MTTSPSADRPVLQSLLDAVSSPIRREILWLVWGHELAAGEIAREFEVTAPTISSHLNALRAAGLVTMRVDGNFRRYRADRDAMAVLVPLLAAGNDRWEVADDIPETDLAGGVVEHWVQVATDVAAAPDDVYADFVDDRRFSRWLGVPVALHDGRFAAELEWGTKVRGHFEVMVPASLIALRWDFDDETVPVPGRQLVAYIRLAPSRAGTRVEVHQHAPRTDQAQFLVTAWSVVLGRLRAHHDRSDAKPRRRPSRPKRRP